MKINAITFYGTEHNDVDKSRYSDDNLELLSYFQVEPKTRGEENLKRIELQKDYIIEFEFGDGTNWITGPDTLDDIFPELLINQKRSGTNEIELPVEIGIESDNRSLAGKILLKAFKIFSKKLVSKEVKELAEKLENKQLDDNFGLFSLNHNFQLTRFIPDASPKPYLLFIHGTASSTSGSFGDIKNTELMNYVRETYGDRLLAFQHRTLTHNPLQNVKDLVESLPASCALHLITTSRGGLVGEILSRFCNSRGNTGFNATELAILKKGYPDNYFSGIENFINEIRTILAGKKIIIGKFVRIACPAGGTTLASKRLDHFFNITINLVGLATGIAANPLYMAFRSLITSLIDSKNKPEILPGLEVQRPGSPFIKALNCTTDLSNPDGRILINNSLVVIAGNSKPALKLSALWIIASKLFFLTKNDLVVDTESMIMGTRRDGKVQRFFHEDDQLNHFRYFENTATSQAILLALKSNWGEKLPGFTEEPLSLATACERNINVRPDGGKIFMDEVSGARPIVLLLPGIMGSNLEYEDNLLWINYLKIITGGLKDLNTDSATSKTVKATSLVATSYKKLAEELHRSYDVVTFPFDWRLALEESAKKLNEKIIQLMKHNQPIKLIGHSMGGVLIRDFIVLHRKTWEKLNNSNGFRLIFLGAPLGGSFRIPVVLFGMDRLIDKLSLMDALHTKKELLRIFSKFRGLSGLLPFDEKYDFSDLQTWRQMADGMDEPDWPLPSENDLKWFGEYRDKMKNALTADDLKNAVYIAGRDKATPCDFRIEETSSGKELVFLSTGEGDQSVTWKNGIPALLNEKSIYYVNVSHGELACQPDLFHGIKEILEKGFTNLFSNYKPTLRGNELLFKMPDLRDFDLSQAGIDLSVLGVGGSKEPQMDFLPIRISISHGDLFYARYPLLAGHFENDGILAAEREIDINLSRTLSYRQNLGIYPGPVGSNEVFLTSGSSGFRGAIIVGLGKQEELTSAELTKTVEQGVSKYLLCCENNPENCYSEIKGSFGISSLLIGSGYGGLSVENSVKAIIQGVQNANNKIKSLNRNTKTEISYIEFVELFQDVAVNALYSLCRIEKQETRSLKIVVENKRLNTLLGAKIRIPSGISADWWNRITVTKSEIPDSGNNIRCLIFNASTSSAQEKEKELFSTPVLMEGTIKEMSTDNRWTPQKAKTIFELLVPNDFKEQLKKHGNINWILDEYTAEYPWELLQDEVTDTRPLCVASGMIRQLKTSNYRQIINSAPKANALVIADPDLKGFASQLPGALKEGQLVSEILAAQNLDVTTSFKGNHAEIIEKLFCNDYRIIHLSGHGVFNHDPLKGSGMVIGKEMYLSTREIRQMSTVPELVFVNCCHIGKISGEAEEFYQNRYKLAANIGTQLIENGVKCVIAAGWAVDDEAALKFADVFYSQLFKGYSFGESVKAARKAVFEYFGNTNTWGAYQCYGDPFYKFESRVEERQVKKKVEYLISNEAEVDLTNLINELEIGKKPTAEYLKILESISAEVDKAGVRTPSITEKEAIVYFELREYKKACEKFGPLLNIEDASFSFSVAELYYNAQAKKITTEFREKTGKQTATAGFSETVTQACLAEIEQVIRNLEILTELTPSAQRFNILGSACKRKAFMLKDSKIGSYKTAAKYYRKAYSFRNTWYSLTNWLSLESVLVLAGIHNWGSETQNNTLPGSEEALRLLTEMESSFCKNKERMSYWDMLAGINIALCRFIVQFSLKDEKKAGEDIQTNITELWKKAGSKGKRFAEVEHLEFIIDALSITKNSTANSLKAKLEQIKNELAKQIEP